MKERKVPRIVPRLLLICLAVVIVMSPAVPTQAQGGACRCGGREFDDSTNNPYTCGQCTWYASYMRQDIPDTRPSWGDGGSWNGAASDAGFHVSPIPYPLSIAVYEGYLPEIDDRGHVAYVEGVSFGGSFRVSEMNWNGRCFNEGRWDIPRAGVSFIYPPADDPGHVLPYEGTSLQYEGAVELRWYGGAAPYRIELRVVPQGSASVDQAQPFASVWGIAEDRIDLNEFESPNPFGGRYIRWYLGTSPFSLPRGTYYWRIKDDDGEWSTWRFFHLLDCRPTAPAGFVSQVSQTTLGNYLVRLPILFGGSSQGQGAIANSSYYCPGDLVNPTRVPTSTPFPTETRPAVTSVPSPQPTVIQTAVPTADRSQCQSESRDGVYLYTSPNFGGDCIYLTDSHPNLGQTIVGHSTSSIKINGHYSARLYEGISYQGRYDELHADDSNLDPRSLGNHYASIEVIDTTPHLCSQESLPGVYLYAQIGYQGNCLRLTNTGCHNLQGTVIGDNTLQSLRLVNGNGDYWVRVYEYLNGQGRYDELHTNQDDLNWRSLGRQYSSVEVFFIQASPTNVPRTATPLPTAAKTSSPTRSPTTTRTPVPSPTRTLTPTITPIPSPSPTRTGTPRPSATPPAPPTPVLTATTVPSTSTPWPTETEVPTNTLVPPTATPPPPPTVEISPTASPTRTNQPTPSASSGPTATRTASLVPSPSPTLTSTPTRVPTVTPLPPPPPPPVPIPTATVQPRPTRTVVSGSTEVPPPSPTSVLQTATPIPPVVLTPVRNPTATPPR